MSSTVRLKSKGRILNNYCEIAIHLPPMKTSFFTTETPSTMKQKYFPLVNSQREMSSRSICLTEDQAIEIYHWKVDTVNEYVKLGCVDMTILKGKSALLSRMYSVSPKTIRDIWNRNTWVRATSTMWSLEDPIFNEKYTQVRNYPLYSRSTKFVLVS